MMNSPRTLAVAGGLVLLAGCGSTVQVRSSTPTSGLASDSGLGTDSGGAGVAVTPEQAAAAAAGNSSSPGQGPVGSLTGGTSPTGLVGNTGAPGATVAPVTAAGGIPASGPGWDAKSVYIGVSTEEDLHQAAGSFGVSFDPGSIKGDAEAVIADINAHGGLFGRKVVGVYQDNATADLQANPASAAQRNCSTFTQDHRVVAVLNPVAPIDNENFRECMRRAHTPLFSMGYNTYDNQIYREAGPYIWTLMMPNLNRLMPAWVAALQRQSYFTGWDTSKAGPGPAPVKVGILEPGTPIGKRTTALIRSQLQKAGVAVGSEFTYQESTASYGSDMSAAVLNFRSAGVTHVLNLSSVTAAWIVFMQTAEQQGFRPRYGLTTFSLGQTAADNGGGRQLNGSVGIGWVPGSDVDAKHFPAPSAAQKSCRAALARQGQTFKDSQGLALWVGLVLCDSLHFVADAAIRAQGLAPQQIARGMAALGVQHQLASTFSSSLSASNHGVPGTVRDLYYVPSCTCYQYRGPAHAL